MEVGERSPSESDSIMASALLSISRNGGTKSSGLFLPPNEDIAEADTQAPKVIAGMRSSYQTGDLMTSMHINTTMQQAFEDTTKSATTGRRPSSRSRPIELHLSQLAQFHANMVQEQAHAAVVHSNFIYSTPTQFIESLAKVSPAAPESSTQQSSEQISIRQKEIEKALQSKSQRGRKRANLNEEERLELTRTRNREHAKSTRIRKKMRYEELLDCEAKMQAIEAKEDLDQRRRRCVVDFLSVREQMIQAQPVMAAESHLTQRLIALFQDDSSVIYDDGIADSEKHTVIERMKKFDRFLLSRINVAAKEEESSLSYRLKDPNGLSSIAISKDGSALVEVDIFTNGVNDRNLVLSFLLKNTFEPLSEKIRSITIIQYDCDVENCNTKRFNIDGADNDIRQNLEGQMSYPSVVSLDVERDYKQNVDTSEDKRCESDDGIGMPLYVP